MSCYNTLRLARLHFQGTLQWPRPYCRPCTEGDTFHHRNQCTDVCMATSSSTDHCKAPCHRARNTTFCNDGGYRPSHKAPATWWHLSDDNMLFHSLITIHVIGCTRLLWMINRERHGRICFLHLLKYHTTNYFGDWKILWKRG